MYYRRYFHDLLPRPSSSSTHTAQTISCVMLVCEIDELSIAIYHKHCVVQQSTFANCKSNMPRASLTHQIVNAVVGGGRRGVLIRSH